MLLLTALIVSLAGLVGVYRRLLREFPPGVALTVVVLLAGATPLAWYTVFEPSLLDVTAFTVTAWLGVAAYSSYGVTRRWDSLTLAAWVGLCAVPIAAIWWTVVAGAGFDPLHSRWPQVLFSSWHGFLSWTPVVYAAVVGTLLYARRGHVWALTAVGLLLAAAWLVGASDSWLHEPAFGARPLISVLVLLAPGLAYLVAFLRARAALALVPLVALPIVWNHLLMVQYTIGMLPKDEPISFARMVRQQADLHARTTPFYPFAFPANLWFAWREGVPVDRYDVLALEPRVSSLDLALDRHVDRFLLEGWAGMTAQGEEPGWWIDGRQASLAVPLAVGSARAVRVTVVARSRYEEPVVEADLALLINGLEVGTFSPSATRSSEAQFTAPSTAFRDGFNRISIVSRGTHRVDPSDTRPPGPLARRGIRSGWPVAIYRLAITPM